MVLVSALLSQVADNSENFIQLFHKYFEDAGDFKLNSPSTDILRKAFDEIHRNEAIFYQLDSIIKFIETEYLEFEECKTKVIITPNASSSFSIDSAEFNEKSNDFFVEEIRNLNTLLEASVFQNMKEALDEARNTSGQIEKLSRHQQDIVIELFQVFFSLEKKFYEVALDLNEFTSRVLDGTQRFQTGHNEYLSLVTENLLLKFKCLKAEIHSTMYDRKVRVVLEALQSKVDGQNAALLAQIKENELLLSNLNRMGPDLLAIANEYQSLNSQIEFIQDDIVNLRGN